ncbi:hypothetical protein [Streptomyces venezuelae]|uniref:hypothetical protein n=1 Tax=Streptomyces venezuelae TaxID=54571 RepID=UPI0034231445
MLAPLLPTGAEAWRPHVWPQRQLMPGRDHQLAGRGGRGQAGERGQQRGVREDGLRPAAASRATGSA